MVLALERCVNLQNFIVKYAMSSFVNLETRTATIILNAAMITTRVEKKSLKIYTLSLTIAGVTHV